MAVKELSAGTFLMGSPESEEGRRRDEDQHEVTISKSFYMQTTEVTQGQWKSVMGTEPWRGSSNVNEYANNPAVCVSWIDANAFCKKLSDKEGKTYRLPTEAEWEYACRAGTQTTWNFGNDKRRLADYAWFGRKWWNSLYLFAQHVGRLQPNAFGLYDMHGNVFEWCSDYYGEDYYQQSPEKDPQGPTQGSSRVLRGGSWNIDSHFTRSAYRFWRKADSHNGDYGFRLVRELD